MVRSLEVGPTPHGLAISRDGHLLLVAGFGSNQVLLINTVTDGIVGQVLVPQPHNSAISPDGGTAYVASQEQGNAALIVLDLASRTKVGRVPLEQAPRALAFTADGRRLYFTVAGSDSVQILDPARNQVVSWIQVGDYSFTPAVLRGQPGQRLRLEVENESGILHNIIIPEQQIDTDIPPHRKVVVEVTIPQSGMVRFFCKFHAALGMSGALLTGEATP